jgi:hypothetical protein
MESKMDEREISYSLCKQLNDDLAPMEISTNYGDVPLTDEDRAAVRQLLRKRFEKRLRALTSDSQRDKNRGSAYYELFELMSREHGLILLETELQEIVQVAAQTTKKPVEKI